MKRRNKISFKHPPKNRSSSIEGFTGARRSDNRSDATTSLEPEEDMSRVKRVRFHESKADHHPNTKPGATSIPSEAVTGAESNAPKTSEFAFFKKIKERACNHTYQLPKEDGQVKDVKSREPRGETSFMIEQNRSYLRSSLHVEKARPLNQQCFPSPLVDASMGSGLDHIEPTSKNVTPPLPLNKVKPGRHDWYSPSLGGRSRNSAMCSQEAFEQSRSYPRSSLHVEKARTLNQQHFSSPLVDASKSSGLNHVEPTYKNIIPPLHINKVKPGRHDQYSPFLGGRSRNSGNKCSDKGVFFAKRQKLRQLVADTTLLEVDEPCSKGSSLVSGLLNRLFPDNTENTLCRNARSSELQSDIQPQQTAYTHSGMHVKKLCKTRIMNLNGKVNGPYFDDAHVKSRSNPDISRPTPELDIISLDSPSTSYAARTSSEYRYSRSLRNEHRKSITGFLRENDSSFLDSIESYDFTPSGHLKELEYFVDYNKPEFRVQPHNHLLSWDDNNENYERNIAESSFNADVNYFPMLETSRNVDDMQGVHNELICLPPPFPENSQNLPILPHYHLESFHNDFQSHLGEENYQRALTLPRSSKYIELIEDCIPENTLESSIIELTPRDSVQEHDCSLEPLLFPTRLEFASEWKFLPMSHSSGKFDFTDDAFWYLLKEGLHSPPLRKDDEEDDCTYRSNSLDIYEGTATDHDWSVNNFKRSSDTGHSLLLHDSSWSYMKMNEKVFDSFEQANDLL